MNPNLLFAIDPNTQEVIVSDSPKGSNQIHLIERIHQQDHPILFHAVVTLTSLANEANIDASIFKAMDKVCQMIYSKDKKMKEQ